MKKLKEIDIVIDRLTNSIENAISGDSFKTEVIVLSKEDLKNIKKKDWGFDWKEEFKSPQKQLFKLVIKDNPQIIQGLVSIRKILP